MATEPALPFDAARSVGAACLCLAVQRAGRRVGRRFDEAFRPLGLTNWQFSLMTALHRPEPLSIGGLAERLATDRTTVTANLKPLERRGLVAVRRDAADARTRRVSLTPEGVALLAQAQECWAAANAATEAEVGPDGLAALRAALGRMGLE